MNEKNHMDNEEKVNLLITKMLFGDPVLFTGAGFSYGMSNLQNQSPKGSVALSNLLQKEENIPYKLSLKDNVDYYLLEKKGNHLIDILDKEFTIGSVCNYHNVLAKIDWKRCYTTNYDCGFEIASRNVNKNIRAINPLSSSENFRDGNVCIHINGDMSILTSETLKKEFQLGDLSYVLNDFDKTYWYKLLQKDFDSASAIVFIGYSLYDDLIKQILKSNENFKEKTFIVTSSEANDEDLFKLNRYGYVINIGTEGFSELIYKKYEQTVLSSKKEKLQNLIKCENNIKENIEIKAIDIENFLLSGKIEKKKIHRDYKNFLEKKDFHFVPRLKDIMECVDKIKHRKNILIKSEIGNGKSIFLEQLIVHLLEHEDVNVYIPDDVDTSVTQSYLSDLEKLAKSDILSIIICDDLNKNLSLASDFSMIKQDNILLVASIRSVAFDTKELYDIEFDHVNIDELSSTTVFENGKTEIDCFIELISILNFWGMMAASSQYNKRAVFQKNYENQMSGLLLDLLSSEHIVLKIKASLQDDMKNENTKKILFLILLFKYLGIEIDKYIIKGLLQNDYVDSSEFIKKSNGSSMYTDKKKDGYTNKSSMYCRATLRNVYGNQYKTNMFLDLVGVIENEKNRRNSEIDSNIIHLKNNLIKEIMRFSPIDNLLKDGDGKKKQLFEYYSNLILKAKWLLNESHYWLQLAMARITNDMLYDAEKDLQTAYKLAEKKQILKDYSVSSIDTQYARLLIKKSLKEQHNDAIWNFFIHAHNLLSRCNNDKYRYRQVRDYKTFFDLKYSALSPKNKAIFKTCCEYMLNEINKITTSDRGDPAVQNCELRLHSILDEILEN